MNKITKIVAVIAGLLAFSSANAGELTVTGSMQATYQSETNGVTGNPLGLNTDLAFTGTTEVLDGVGVTWTMATDGTFLGESSADHKLAFSTGYGIFQLGNTDDAANNVDDITPTAFEEANGSGSGTYTVDFGGDLEGSMSVGYRNADLFGFNVQANYYPKVDATTNNEKVASGDVVAASKKKSGKSISIATSLANVPVIGDTVLGGLKITTGYHKSENITDTNQDQEGGTVALNYAMGPVSLGYQKKAYATWGTTAAADTFFKDTVWGVAYAVNDALAISYNVYTSDQHDNDGTEVEQETTAINLAYTVGGLTIGFQDASTDNAAYTAAKNDDTRTISIKTAF